FEIRKSQIRKNLLDNVESALVLKDLVAGIHGQQPEPGIDLGKIGGEARRFARLRKASDHSIDILLVAATRQLNGDGDVLSDNLREINGGILREQFQVIVKQPGDLLFTLKALQNKFIRTERSG